MNAPLNILHLEDNRNDSELVRRSLEADGIVSRITRVDTRADFLTAIDQGGVDCIFADYALPGFDGMSALEVVRENHCDVPFILISGAIGEELAIESLKSGATDYVLKHRLSRL